MFEKRVTDDLLRCTAFQVPPPHNTVQVLCGCCSVMVCPRQGPWPACFSSSLSLLPAFFFHCDRPAVDATITRSEAKTPSLGLLLSGSDPTAPSSPCHRFPFSVSKRKSYGGANAEGKNLDGRLDTKEISDHLVLRNGVDW